MTRTTAFYSNTINEKFLSKIQNKCGKRQRSDANRQQMLIKFTPSEDYDRLTSSRTSKEAISSMPRLPNSSQCNKLFMAITQTLAQFAFKVHKVPQLSLSGTVYCVRNRSPLVSWLCSWFTVRQVDVFAACSTSFCRFCAAASMEGHLLSHGFTSYVCGPEMVAYCGPRKKKCCHQLSTERHLERWRIMTGRMQIQAVPENTMECISKTVAGLGSWLASYCLAREWSKERRAPETIEYERKDQT